MQSSYVVKGGKLYKNGEIVGNRKIHILDSNQLQVKSGKYVLSSLLLHKLKNKNVMKKQQPRENVTQVCETTIPSCETTTTEEVTEQKIYQYELTEQDALDVLSRYSKTTSGGVVYMTCVKLNTLCYDSSSLKREIPFYHSFASGTFLVLGKTYSLTVTICDVNITYPAASVSIWIDWKQTNSYNEEDWTQIGSYIPIGGSATVEIVVPNTAKLGTTGMRIRSRGASDGNKNGATDAYVNMGSGDTQDYPITIVPN